MQNVYRKVVGVVGLSIQDISEADFGDRRRISAVGRAIKYPVYPHLKCLFRQTLYLSLIHSLLKYIDPLQLFL